MTLVTLVSVNGTLVEAKMCTFALESTHFIFNQCPIYTHDGVGAKFITKSHKTDYSAEGHSGQLAYNFVIYTVKTALTLISASIHRSKSDR